jgi:hypothetical protein
MICIRLVQQCQESQNIIALCVHIWWNIYVQTTILSSEHSACSAMTDQEHVHHHYQNWTCYLRLSCSLKQHQSQIYPSKRPDYDSFRKLFFLGKACRTLLSHNSTMYCNCEEFWWHCQLLIIITMKYPRKAFSGKMTPVQLLFTAL